MRTVSRTAGKTTSSPGVAGKGDACVVWWCNSARHCFVRSTSMDAVLQGEEARRPAPLHAPGNRSQLVLLRSRGDYGCVWTTCARRTDAPMVFRLTRITRREVAARNRWARFPAATCGGALRNAPAAESPRPAVKAGNNPGRERRKQSWANGAEGIQVIKRRPGPGRTELGPPSSQSRGSRAASAAARSATTTPRQLT